MVVEWLKTTGVMLEIALYWVISMLVIFTLFGIVLNFERFIGWCKNKIRGINVKENSATSHG